MAVTVQSQPVDYSPAYNENWWVALSSQFAQPNMKYTVIVTDVITGTVLATEQILPHPSDHKLYFDSSPYAQQLMTDYLPANLYGWQKCAGAIRKIKVNIGETYGTTPTYHAGTDIFYITWNSAFDMRDILTYNPSNYVYDFSIPNKRFLTYTANSKTYTDRSQYLYALVQQGNTTDIPGISIYTFDATGIILAAYTIPRPSFSTGVYTDQYACIDIGHKGMANIPSGLVTVISGTYPIITPNVAGYRIYDDTDNSLLTTITLGCNPRYDTYSIHYLNSKGSYETLHLELASEESQEAVENTFKQNPWKPNSSNVMVLDPQLAFEKSQGITITNKLKLTSDWLTQAEMNLHKDLFASVDIKLDTGSTTNLIKVKLNSRSYTSRNTDKKRQIVLDLSYAHQNVRQRG